MKSQVIFENEWRLEDYLPSDGSLWLVVNEKFTFGTACPVCEALRKDGKGPNVFSKASNIDGENVNIGSLEEIVLSNGKFRPTDDLGNWRLLDDVDWSTRFEEENAFIDCVKTGVEDVTELWGWVANCTNGVNVNDGSPEEIVLKGEEVNTFDNEGRQLSAVIDLATGFNEENGFGVGENAGLVDVTMPWGWNVDWIDGENVNSCLFDEIVLKGEEVNVVENGVSWWLLDGIGWLTGFNEENKFGAEVNEEIEDVTVLWDWKECDWGENV